MGKELLFLRVLASVQTLIITPEVTLYISTTQPVRGLLICSTKYYSILKSGFKFQSIRESFQSPSG